jgi:hypothetical protein
MPREFFHARLFPEGEPPVSLHVFKRNRVSSNDHGQHKLLFNKNFKLPEPWTWRVSHHKTGGQMDDIASVFYKFRGHVFHVSARTTAAS